MIFLDSVSILRNEDFVDGGIDGMIYGRCWRLVADLDGGPMLGGVRLIFLSLI